MKRRLTTLAVIGGLAIVYTWPLALQPEDVVFTRQFDGWGTLWMADGGRRFVGALRDPLTEWPVGASLARPDSLVWMYLGALLDGLVAPRTLFHATMLLGPVLGGLAAERCARVAFGVSHPWSILAGIVYGFSGLSATACLEGHVYLLLNPWLPLLLTDLHRGLAPGGTRRALLQAVLWGTLALATSAYTGICAALLTTVWLVRALATRANHRALGGTLALPLLLGVVVALVYASSFHAGEGLSTPTGWAPAGVQNPRNALGWTPSADLSQNHSIAAPLGALPFAAVLLAPLALRHRTGWRGLLALALVALIIAFGSMLEVDRRARVHVPMPMSLVQDLPVIELLHFPVRLLWDYYLGAGILAALLVGELARRVGGRAAAPGFLLAIGDALVGTGMPWRMVAAPAAIPAAYAAAPEGRAILDLTGRSLRNAIGDAGSASSADALAVFRTLSCYYQTVHGRPILESCLMPVDSPRLHLSDRLADVALAWADGDPDAPSPAELRDTLVSVGVGAVAVHLDLIGMESRPATLAAMEAIAGPPAATSTDAGETVVLYVLEGSAESPAAAWRALREGD